MVTGAVDLAHLADELLARAAGDRSHRAARTLPHPVDGLRQTMIALVDGGELQEHNSPGPASLLVLRGTARLVTGDGAVSLQHNSYAPIPPARHRLIAEQDCVVLLSVALPGRDTNAGGGPAPSG